MDEKKYLSKKTKRKNDKNMPHYTKEDDIKYNIKNKIIENQKKSKKESKEKKKNKKIKNKDEVNNEEEELENNDTIENKEQIEEIKINDKQNIKEENSENEDNESENENDNIIEDENKDYDLYKKLNKKLIIVLEGATLELGSLKKDPKLLNCDEHYKIIKSMKKKLDEFRPDIIHQCLLNLFDSPLNKVGLLQVYIHTNKNILIEINPKTRMPRTFKRFSGLFTQLLLKNEIKASDTDETLMKVINSKIENILDKNTPKILLSAKGRLIDIDTYIKNLDLSIQGEKLKPNNICFIIGTNPKGEIDPLIRYNDDCISLSSFDLDSNVVCAKICSSFEKVWDIL